MNIMKNVHRFRFERQSIRKTSNRVRAEIESLSKDVFETRTAAGRRMQLLWARSDLNQSVGKPLFKHFKLNATDKRSVASARKKNSQLPAAVRISKTSVLLLLTFII